MECELAGKQCVPCRGGVPALKGDALSPLADQLDGGWEIIDEHHLTRTWKFKDFAEALAFTNKVGQLADQQGHHPDISLSWGRVSVKVHTHKVNGLTESDFILAAKIDQL